MKIPWRRRSAFPVFFYRAFGLNIASEFDLPELRVRPETPESDVYVRWGAVPETLPGVDASSALFQAVPDRFLLANDQRGRHLWVVVEGMRWLQGTFAVRFNRLRNSSTVSVRPATSYT